MVRAAAIVARDRTGLYPVFGVPVARRLVLSVLGLGIRVVHVFGRDDGLRQVLSDLIPAHAFHEISDVRELEGAAEMIRLGDGDQVMVMRANQVIDRWSLRRLLETGDGSAFLTGLGDGDAKAEIADQICMVTADHLACALASRWSGGEQACSAVSACRPVRIAGGLPYALTEGKESASIAEGLLLEALGRATKATDSFFSRLIHRPISRFISKRLVRTSVTPNMVTLFNIMVGLTGAFFLATGTYAMQVLGSLLFLWSTILDGVDGEMARLTLKETVLGHYLDIVGDNVVHVAVFLGIALGLYRHTLDPVYLHAFWFLLCGFGLCALSVQLVMGHGPKNQKSKEAPWLAALIVNRDFAYLVALLAVLHCLSWFLFGAAAGVYAAAIALFVVTFKRQPATSA